ncbi:MAG TPA: type 1 glutamine amidotransferase [Actinomycetota bacterium]|nr:type 1 glutamine amidotransferase [Actinomycetota bacterium]
MRPLAVIQHEPSVPPGLIGSSLKGSGLDHFVLEAWRDPAWPRADELAGLVVLGGTMNVDQLEDYPFLRSSRRLLTDALERELPVLGVCLGSQMLARVLGGDVFRADPRNAFFSSVEVPAEETDDPLIAPFASGAPVLQFHEDTFTLPPGAVPLARSASSGLLQAFRFGGNAYAIQFHFEVDSAILAGWCRNIGDPAMRDDWGIRADELLAQGARHFDAQRRAGMELCERFAGLVADPIGLDRS